MMRLPMLPNQTLVNTSYCIYKNYDFVDCTLNFNVYDILFVSKFYWVKSVDCWHGCQYDGLVRIFYDGLVRIFS